MGGGGAGRASAFVTPSPPSSLRGMPATAASLLTRQPACARPHLPVPRSELGLDTKSYTLPYWPSTEPAAVRCNLLINPVWSSAPIHCFNSTHAAPPLPPPPPPPPPPPSPCASHSPLPAGAACPMGSRHALRRASWPPCRPSSPTAFQPCVSVPRPGPQPKPLCRAQQCTARTETDLVVVLVLVVVPPLPPPKQGGGRKEGIRLDHSFTAFVCPWKEGRKDFLTS